MSFTSFPNPVFLPFKVRKMVFFKKLPLFNPKPNAELDPQNLVTML